MFKAGQRVRVSWREDGVVRWFRATVVGPAQQRSSTDYEVIVVESGPGVDIDAGVRLAPILMAGGVEMTADSTKEN